MVREITKATVYRAMNHFGLPVTIDDIAGFLKLGAWKGYTLPQLKKIVSKLIGDGIISGEVIYFDDKYALPRKLQTLLRNQEKHSMEQKEKRRKRSKSMVDEPKEQIKRRKEDKKKSESDVEFKSSDDDIFKTLRPNEGRKRTRTHTKKPTKRALSLANVDMAQDMPVQKASSNIAAYHESSSATLSETKSKVLEHNSEFLSTEIIREAALQLKTISPLLWYQAQDRKLALSKPKIASVKVKKVPSARRATLSTSKKLESHKKSRPETIKKTSKKIKIRFKLGNFNPARELDRKIRKKKNKQKAFPGKEVVDPPPKKKWKLLRMPGDEDGPYESTISIITHPSYED